MNPVPLHPHRPPDVALSTRAVPASAAALACATWLPGRQLWGAVAALQASSSSPAFVALRTGENEEETRRGAVVAERGARAARGAALGVRRRCSAVLLSMLAMAALLGPGEPCGAPSPWWRWQDGVVLGLGFRTGKAGGEMVYAHGAASAYARARRCPRGRRRGAGKGGAASHRVDDEVDADLSITEYRGDKRMNRSSSSWCPLLSVSLAAGTAGGARPLRHDGWPCRRRGAPSARERRGWCRCCAGSRRRRSAAASGLQEATQVRSLCRGGPSRRPAGSASPWCDCTGRRGDALHGPRCHGHTACRGPPIVRRRTRPRHQRRRRARSLAGGPSRSRGSRTLHSCRGGCGPTPTRASDEREAVAATSDPPTSPSAARAVEKEASTEDHGGVPTRMPRRNRRRLGAIAVLTRPRDARAGRSWAWQRRPFAGGQRSASCRRLALLCRSRARAAPGPGRRRAREAKRCPPNARKVRPGLRCRALVRA
jgi:hypothetical protein